ncbi:Homogentisate 1,2-dioxygenase [Myriangium duriaei CBS 260.36]|uniref:homogentisate 1,2-dioxygenase n=1 Tax=Myriangium duriaei CBS 260.36 TaxID=1168546 RepID=A0A9P4JEP0_9PEZI|nr:Homogentisate 1,2-dioxygenase [Myriangium duriaei CBS 260.36]
MASERAKLLKTPFKERVPKTDVFNVFHYTDLMRKKHTREGDSYEYQHGFGNRHMSEVIPGTLPVAQNNPQQPRFGLYVEGLTGSSFAAPRAHNYSTYIYRVRPGAAHAGFVPIESKANIENCFLSLNPKVESLVEQAEWAPFPLPKDGDKIDFVDGLHTLGGSGDPNLREGIALYIYTINADMENRAFCNTDGDFLICGQLGDLDIQTEFGMIYLAPGEICVIQRGVRFKIKLGKNTTAARGYITEIWGSIWELPDLGPIGGHGLANARDFLFPVAHIDENLHGNWIIVNKNTGKYNALAQDHSPFDIVAWHGNVVPYKYDLTKFVSQNATSIDHTDPSINTVLTAKSRDPNTALADFLWFGPRWDVATNSFRPPYFHRNSASEFLTTLFGNGLGRSDDFQPGGGSYEQGHTPHGGFEAVYVTEMRNQESEPRKILEGGLTIMIESSRTFLWTEYARVGCGTLHTQGTNPRVWDVLPDNFSNDPEAKALLKRVKEEKKLRAERDRVYYEDDKLAELLAGKLDAGHSNGLNGVNGH